MIETPGNEERKEYKPTDAAIKDMRDFFDFVKTPTIQNELAQGKKLSDIIYDRFYSEDQAYLKYKESDPRYQALKPNFDRTMTQVEDWCRQTQAWADQQGDRLGFLVQENQLRNGWMYLKTHGGIDTSQPIGRVYINIKPGAAPDFFMWAAEQGYKEGVRTDIKMPREASIDDFNRPDKIVMYFNEADQGKILELLKTYYREKQATFDEGTPRFTAELAKGIGFAEQPMNQSKSFGEVRSEILADMYAAAQAASMSLEDRNFQPAARFITACEKHGVDPENPAFNDSRDGAGRFQIIREQTSG